MLQLKAIGVVTGVPVERDFRRKTDHLPATHQRPGVFVCLRYPRAVETLRITG
jgi:hypothetical protein